MIPKIIHQTWKNKDIPDHWKSSHEGYKRLEARGWEVRLWTDEDNRNLIKEKFPWFLPQFDGYDYGIQRADAIRAFILYEFGGIYSDLDIEPKENFESFYEMYRDSDVVLPKNKRKTHGTQNLTNCFMMSSKGSKFWPIVWEFLKDPFKTEKWKRYVVLLGHHFNILFTTGPGVICDAAVEYELQGGRIVYIPSDLVQPFNEDQEDQTAPHETPQSVTKALEGKSWQQNDSKLWRAIGTATKHGELILGILFGLFFLTTLYYLYKWKLCSSGKVVCSDGVCKPNKNRKLQKSELYETYEL